MPRRHRRPVADHPPQGCVKKGNRHGKVEDRPHQRAGTKKKTVGLTQAEVEEQAVLRREYIDGFKANLKDILDNTVIQRPDGSKTPLKPKRPN